MNLPYFLFYILQERLGETRDTVSSQSSTSCVPFNWMHMTRIISSETEVLNTSVLYKESDIPEIP